MKMMAMNGDQMKICKEKVVRYFKASFQHSSGDTEYDHASQQKDRNSKRVRPGHEIVTLP
jgi:hypothetical protein